MGHKSSIRLVFLLAFGLIFQPTHSARAAEVAAQSRKKNFKTEDTARIAAKVLPKGGYTLPIKWGNLGPTLVQLGVIDLEKFKKLYPSGGLPSYIRYLEQPSEDFISINPENQQFLVTVFWGLGLANKNPVLEKMRETDGFMNLASTGGWRLGVKPATELYSKFDIIALTPEQQELVSDLAQNTYRPCCSNPTALPDCNHGIGLLGLMELMVAQGFSRAEVLKASLQFNAFWFPQHYVQTALLFELGGVGWDAVDAAEVLSSRYSSVSGWTKNVAEEINKLAPPLLAQQGQGSSCQVAAAAAASSGAAPTAKAFQELAPVHALVLDRKNPEVHYVATYKGLVRAPRKAAPEFVGSHRFDIESLVAHPRKPGVLYASGHPDRTTEGSDTIGNLGLLLSRDGGQTWQAAAAHGKAFHALTYSPENGGQLYGWNVAGRPGLYRISLATWAMKRVPAKGLSSVLSLSASPDAIKPLLAGTKRGLMASHDRGASWEPVAGLPTDVQVRAVAHHPTNGRTVYAYIAKAEFGLMRSDDGGATWKPTGFVAASGLNVLALAVSPSENVVSVATQSYLMGISVPLQNVEGAAASAGRRSRDEKNETTKE